MLRRTKGRLLIVLLVITGLAGTVNTSSISKKERKSAVSLMKNTKAELIKSVKGLSDAQLDFKAAPDKWSIKECVYHIAVSEKNLWNMLDETMKKPANAEKRSEIKFTDEQILAFITSREKKVKTFEAFEPKNTPYKSLREALEDFKTRRTNNIKYMKSTTEDMRNHVAQLAFGWIDCYQLSLFIAGHTDRHLKQIEEVKADPAFPKK
jgi:hypothetical protein